MDGCWLIPQVLCSSVKFLEVRDETLLITCKGIVSG